MKRDPQDMESAGMVFRAFHTVKGISAFFELALLAEFGDHAESIRSRSADLEVAAGQTVIGSNCLKRNLWSR
jgi:two-component system chemotaxis sensor kinase CheA